MNPFTETDLATGLTHDEYSVRPKNAPLHHKSPTEIFFAVAYSQMLSFFFVLLIISGFLSIYLHHILDGVIFLVIAFCNLAIGTVQEFKAHKSTQALEQLISHKVCVLRDGAHQTIKSSDLVCGDIVVLEPGDVVPADMVVRFAEDAFLDQSSLTGESIPIEATQHMNIQSGTSLVSGDIIGQVTAVGKESSILMYAQKIESVSKSDGFGKFITFISISVLVFTIICLLLVLLLNVFQTHSLTLPDFLLYAVSMLVGVVPESLPLIITIILSNEALLLAKSGVIVKKLSVLQNIGSMEYFFTDKTGTLTENKLKVETAVSTNNLLSILAVVAYGDYKRTPMDEAFDSATADYLKNHSIRIDEKKNLHITPFSSARGYSIFTDSNNHQIIRGVFEKVIESCGQHDHNHNFITTCSTCEEKGLRVIAYAYKSPTDTEFTLCGAITFEDPLKTDAKTTYHQIHNLGIDIKMITGDSSRVASYIESKLTNESSVIYDFKNSTCALEMNDTYAAYACCSPDQKIEIIDLFTPQGVVGFLGEGINDALALRRSDIGFVVHNASDVALQSGDVILLEKSLSPVITAITASRTAFAHIKTYLLCTLAGNIGTLISLTIVALLWQEIPMLPIQILLNNLLTDVPLIFIIRDTLTQEATKKPIKNFRQQFIMLVLSFAILSSLFDLIFFSFFKHYDLSVLQSGWLVFSVLSELVLVVSLRSFLPIHRSPKIDRSLLFAVIGCAGAVFAIPFIPFLENVFHVTALTLSQSLIIVGVVGVYVIANEILKRFIYKK